MKKIFSLFIYLLLATASFTQAPTAFILEDVTSNATEFKIGVTFDVDGPGPLILDNSTIHVFLDQSFTAVASDIQGGSWTTTLLGDNAALTGACGAGAAGNYALWAISANGEANLGAVVAGVKEDLLTITVSGPGDINSQIFVFDPVAGDPLSVCLNGAVKNTASIDPNDGGVFTGYEDIPGGASISLPIELLSFTAKKLDKNSVDLRWSTSSEVNSSHFEIEKSKDGFFFQKFDEVKASGNTSSRQDYSLIDEVLAPTQKTTTYYYRLKMIDLDGRYEYSDVRSVSFGGYGTPSLSAFPNPATNRLSINTSEVDGEIKVQMTDIQGMLVYKNTIPENTDIFDIYVDEANLYPGTYFMQIIQGNQVVGTEKVIIMKY